MSRLVVLFPPADMPNEDVSHCCRLHHDEQSKAAASVFDFQSDAHTRISFLTAATDSFPSFMTRIFLSSLPI